MNVSFHPNPSVSRREKILDLVRRQGFVSIPDLRDALDVSESTIRRDLEILEENGEARRTHGGVFSTGPSASVRQFGSKSGQWEETVDRSCRSGADREPRDDLAGRR